MGAKEIEIRVVRPVNPDGVSFVKYLFGAIIGQLGSDFVNENRKTISRMITRLGYKIDEKVQGGFITGEFSLVVEDGKPVKIVAKRLEVYKKTEEINEEIAVSAPEE